MVAGRIAQNEEVKVSHEIPKRPTLEGTLSATQLALTSAECALERILNLLINEGPEHLDTPQPSCSMHSAQINRELSDRLVTLSNSIEAIISE